MVKGLLDGRAWHGDHLIDAATIDAMMTVDSVDDGSEADGGLVHRVHEFDTAVEGAVLIHVSSITSPRKAPPTAPLSHLAEGPTFSVPFGVPARVKVVARQAPDGLDAAESMGREMTNGAGAVLATVRWGDVDTWRPARPTHGAPATIAGPAVLIGLAPAERLVPSVRAARRLLAKTDVLPGGGRGQNRRKNGLTWPSVPQVASWRRAAADPWVVSGLLEHALDPLGARRSSALGIPSVRMLTLVPGGAPVLVAGAGSVLIPMPDDGVLTLWEGKDESGRTVGIALHRSADQGPALDLPLWPGQRPADPPDVWSGEVLQHEDGGGGVIRSRLRVTAFGRLTVPSRRIVASDPCVAGVSPALGITLGSEGPFPVLRADLMGVTEDGAEVDERERGIILVIDEQQPPVRWEHARGEGGEPITCVIDTGQLLLADAVGAHAVQRGYDEGTVDFGARCRLALLRSDPDRPADIAVLADLGGDGPAWIVVGVGADERPVAVMVSNFDPLS